MKLTSDNETLAENKVLILYILNKVNKPLTNDALLQLVLSITDMNYFYFQQFLLDLLENKYIELFKEDDNEVFESVYRITDLGRETLSLTQDMIPGIVKLKVDSTFKDELAEIKDSVSVVSEFVPIDKNDFNVKCKIIENNRVLFEVNVFAGSPEHAKTICDNWENNAENIYPKIIDLLEKTN